MGYGAENNTEYVDSKKISKNDFSTDKEAKKAYIKMDHDRVDSIKVRKLNDIQFSIGHIINHCLLILGLIFSSN